jgi:carboxylesterase type B
MSFFNIARLSFQSESASTHGSELPFVFGAPLVPGVWHHLAKSTFTKQEAAMAATVMTYWTNFAKSG